MTETGDNQAKPSQRNYRLLLPAGYRTGNETAAGMNLEFLPAGAHVIYYQSPFDAAAELAMAGNSESTVMVFAAGHLTRDESELMEVLDGMDIPMAVLSNTPSPVRATGPATTHAIRATRLNSLAQLAGWVDHILPIAIDKVCVQPETRPAVSAPIPSPAVNALAPSPPFKTAPAVPEEKPVLTTPVMDLTAEELDSLLG